MRFKKVLILDDDMFDLYISKRIISENSFAETTVTVSSVNEAMEYLTLNKAEDTLPDFIFLDLNMPGKTGLDFLREYAAIIKEMKPAIIALLMNVVKSDDDDTKIAKEHPLVSYIFEKPLSAEKLRSVSENKED